MKYCLALLFIISAIDVTNGQITISADEYSKWVLNNTFITSGYGQDTTQERIGAPVFATLAATTGPYKTWDFTPESYTYTPPNPNVTSTSFAYPGDAALANDPDFLSATLVFKTIVKSPPITFYIFYKLDQTGYYELGETRRDSNGTMTKIISYVPPIPIMKFPVAYGTSWQTVINTYNTFLQGNAEVDSINASIDSWGTLITYKDNVNKISNDCLRLKTTTIQNYTYNATPYRYVIVDYKWITKTGYGANFGYQNGAAIPYYSGYTTAILNSVNGKSDGSSELNLRISSNPVQGSEMKVYFTLKNESRLELGIVDALGRQVYSFITDHGGVGENEITINLSDLSNGAYFLRATSDGITATSKLLIQK